MARFSLEFLFWCGVLGGFLVLFLLVCFSLFKEGSQKLLSIRVLIKGLCVVSENGMKKMKKEKSMFCSHSKEELTFSC